MTCNAPNAAQYKPAQLGNSEANFLPLGSTSSQHRRDLPWSLLEDEDYAKIEAAKIPKHFIRGQSIFVQGGTCKGLYHTVSGIVAIRQIESGGGSVITRIAGEGDVLGCRAFFSEGEYPASAEVLAPTTVCFIPGAIIREILGRRPDISLYFLRSMALEQADAVNKYMEYTTLTVSERLLNLVMSFSERYGFFRQDGSMEVHLPTTRQNLASMIGSRTESLVRAIRTLENEMLATFNGRTVVIPRPDLLN